MNESPHSAAYRSAAKTMMLTPINQTGEALARAVDAAAKKAMTTRSVRRRKRYICNWHSDPLTGGTSVAAGIEGHEVETRLILPAGRRLNKDEGDPEGTLRMFIVGRLVLVGQSRVLGSVGHLLRIVRQMNPSRRFGPGPRKTVESRTFSRHKLSKEPIRIPYE